MSWLLALWCATCAASSRPQLAPRHLQGLLLAVLLLEGKSKARTSCWDFFKLNTWCNVWKQRHAEVLQRVPELQQAFHRDLSTLKPSHHSPSAMSLSQPLLVVAVSPQRHVSLMPPYASCIPGHTHKHFPLSFLPRATCPPGPEHFAPASGSEASHLWQSNSTAQAQQAQSTTKQ